MHNWMGMLRAWNSVSSLHKQGSMQFSSELEFICKEKVCVGVHLYCKACSTRTSPLMLVDVAYYLTMWELFCKSSHCPLLFIDMKYILMAMADTNIMFSAA